MNKILKGVTEALEWTKGNIKARLHLPNGQVKEMTIDEYMKERENAKDKEKLHREDPKAPE